MSSIGLEGRSVVITGAGSGICRAAALRFAGEGAKVLVADLNREGAEETVEAIEKAGGVALTVVGDLSDRQVVDKVVERAVGAFGGLDVLVNNTGITDRLPTPAGTDDAESERIIRATLTAPFLVTRAVLPHMLAAGRGSIVFTASETGLRGSAAGAAYTAAKHGLLGLVENFAVMHRTTGIRANAIAPGGTIRSHPHPGRYPDLAGRVGVPKEQAAAIVFLASDAAGDVNGAILPVDNGWSAV